MPRIRLVIDEPTSDLWDDAERRAMLSASANLVDLRWEYRVAEGGCWGARATLDLPAGSYVRQRLVDQGKAGLAWICWDRDETTAAPDEETDLLWFGLVEDAATARAGDLVEIELRGAGEFLRDTLYTGTHKGVSIHDIADAIFDAAIADAQNPITAKDTDNAGALLRKVSIEFTRERADKALQKLAALAGGPAMVCWGTRPSAASSAFGTGYFQLYAGHLYEKDASVDRRAFSVDRSQIIDYESNAKSSEVINHVTVVGGEIEGDPLSDTREFYSGVAYSQASINRYGLRKKTIYDTSLSSDGQCALVASGKCRDSASRRIEARAEIVDEMSNRIVTGAPKYYGLVQTAAKWPARIVTLRDQARSFRAWGDSQKVYRALRDASTARYSTVETANGPTGADIVIQDPKTLASGNKRLYEITRVQTDAAYTTTGPYIMEVDERLSLFYFPSAGAWKLGIGYKNIGGTWTSFGLSTATRSNAQIGAEHTVALEVAYQSGTLMGLAAYWGDGTTTTQMLTGTLAYSSIYGTGTPTRILLNGMGSSGGAPAPAGDCSGADYSQLLVWRAWSGTTASFLNAHRNQTAPFQRWGDLVLMANPAITNGTSAWVRYAFGNATLAGEYAWTPGNAGASSLFATGSAFSRRNYAWMLGDEEHSATMGTHYEVAMEKVRCDFGGRDAPLRIKITGAGATPLASEQTADLAKRIDEAQENATKS